MKNNKKNTKSRITNVLLRLVICGIAVAMLPVYIAVICIACGSGPCGWFNTIPMFFTLGVVAGLPIALYIKD